MLNDASLCLWPPGIACVCVCVLSSLARRQTVQEWLPESHHLWIHLCLSAVGLFVCVCMKSAGGRYVGWGAHGLHSLEKSGIWFSRFPGLNKYGNINTFLDLKSFLNSLKATCIHLFIYQSTNHSGQFFMPSSLLQLFLQHLLFQWLDLDCS